MTRFKYYLALGVNDDVIRDDAYTTDELENDDDYNFLIGRNKSDLFEYSHISKAKVFNSFEELFDFIYDGSVDDLNILYHDVVFIEDTKREVFHSFSLDQTSMLLEPIISGLDIELSDIDMYELDDDFEDEEEFDIYKSTEIALCHDYEPEICDEVYPEDQNIYENLKRMVPNIDEFYESTKKVLLSNVEDFDMFLSVKFIEEEREENYSLFNKNSEGFGNIFEVDKNKICKGLMYNDDIFGLIHENDFKISLLSGVVNSTVLLITHSYLGYEKDTLIDRMVKIRFYELTHSGSDINLKQLATSDYMQYLNGYDKKCIYLGYEPDDVVCGFDLI